MVDSTAEGSSMHLYTPRQEVTIPIFISEHKMNALNVLTKQYTEPHRHYHTLEHIAYMFNTAKEYGVELNEAQRLAIWWHDAVYELGSPINENDSVVLMKNTIDLSDDLLVRATDIIFDTQSHVPKTQESAIVCDLDMFVFADNFNVHHRYTQQIQREFKDIPRDEYRTGRIKFLQKLRDTPILYSNMFGKYRLHAVHAIDKEISDMTMLMAANQ